ncbi:DUF4493 domain-containing protein [Bacteroides caecigallinarum]|uniref:DUF4493 domain-containing protein n=1 Tax=Bacteroides caecigallinarum TaxID=1411144 RepID=UPI00195894EB|nr:DUF4493 domain-containing protein [Bacteroides caecigallinarum]MBM6865327.1 DUF4493 domain-containing protein [Bacteroides caecigallinarum]
MRKLFFTSLTVLLSSIMIFSSCHSEKMDLSVNQTGEVRLSSMTVTYNTEPVVSVSRAADDLANYIIGIYTSSDELVQEWTYSTMPEVFSLSVGTYKVKANSPEVTGAQFDAPYCAGESASFEVKKDNVTEVGELNCTLKSIKVTIEFEQKLKDLIEEGGVIVKVNDETLTFTKDETRSGFFHGNGQSNTVDVEFDAVVEGDQVKRSESYPDLSDGTELKLTFGLKESVDVNPGEGVEYVSNNLLISDEYKEIGVSGTFTPDMEEIPDVDVMMIKGVGFDINGDPLTDFSNGVVVELYAPKGMKDVVVNITSKNPMFESAVSGVFGSNNFSLMDENLQEILGNLGLPVKDDILGKKKVIFDISDFMSLLVDDSLAGLHTFGITITDMEDNSESADLKIDTTK